MKNVLKNNWYLGICLFFIIPISFFVFSPKIDGDGYDYIDSINFLTTGYKDVDFSPNRLLTTFGGLQLIIFLSKIFGSVAVAWMSLNVFLYVCFNILFYNLLLRIHNDKKVALLSTLFLSTNYALISFGLDFLMDMGGWFFYGLCMYFSYLYLEFSNKKYILLASLAVGIGLLFKEYAALGTVLIAYILIYENFQKDNILISIKNIIKKSFYPALFAILPVIILFAFIYLKFNYSYADWLSTNEDRYGNLNKISEYIKSFGSLLNLLGVIFILGVYSLRKNWGEIVNKNKIFIIGVFLSFLPVFIWPGITQRVLFVSVPAIILVSSFGLKRYSSKIVYFIPILILYFLSSLYMDSIILNFVNLPF